jgi:hypothetical protein
LIVLSKNGRTFQLGSEEFDLGIKNIINGKIPKAKFLALKPLYSLVKNDIICGDKTVNNLILMILQKS